MLIVSLIIVLVVVPTALMWGAAWLLVAAMEPGSKIDRLGRELEAWWYARQARASIDRELEDFLHGDTAGSR